METLQTIFSYSGFMVVPLSIGIFVMIHRQRKLVALKDQLIAELRGDLNLETLHNLALQIAFEEAAEKLKANNEQLQELHAKVDKLFPNGGK